MGLIINAIIIIAVVIFGGGAYLYTHPETAKAVIIGGLQHILPSEMRFPDKTVDVITKNPELVNDYNVNKPFNYLLPSPLNKQLNPIFVIILGRPKKIVEFYCTTDDQCISYFKDSNARCETTSGNCYYGG